MTKVKLNLANLPIIYKVEKAKKNGKDATLKAPLAIIKMSAKSMSIALKMRLCDKGRVGEKLYL